MPSQPVSLRKTPLQLQNAAVGNVRFCGEHGGRCSNGTDLSSGWVLCTMLGADQMSGQAVPKARSLQLYSLWSNSVS